MPSTRSTSSIEDIISYIDEKFNNKFDELYKSNEELKLRIIDEIRNEVKVLVEEPLKKIVELESEVEMLQQQIITLKDQNKVMAVKHDEQEQYSSRYCIRLEGIPSKEKESSDDVFHKVNDLFNESDIEVPEDILDREQTIGRVYEGKESGEKRQDVIFRVLNFRYRTVVYKKRKNLKGGVGARLDLTKWRYLLLKKPLNSLMVMMQ